MADVIACQVSAAAMARLGDAASALVGASDGVLRWSAVSYDGLGMLWNALDDAICDGWQRKDDWAAETRRKPKPPRRY